MDCLTRKQLRQCLDFLRAGYACHDPEMFITHLLNGIPTLIPAEITLYTEFNPPERQSRLWLIEPADTTTSEDQRIFEMHAHEQPLIVSLLTAGNEGALKNSDVSTQRKFHHAAPYHEFCRRIRMEHTMAIHLGTPPLIIGIALHRAPTDFTERERLLFDLLRPHLVQAYTNIQAISEIRQKVRLQCCEIDTNKQGVVVLTKDGRVTWLSSRVESWFTVYFGQTSTPQYLPEALRTWLSRQEAALDRADDVLRPSEPLWVQRDETCLLVRHLCETHHCLLFLEERRTASKPFSITKGGLTRREAEVLRWVARGKTNAEIGRILNVSTRTVQKHLEHIYEKLGVETRIAAAGLAMGPGL